MKHPVVMAISFGLAFLGCDKNERDPNLPMTEAPSSEGFQPMDAEAQARQQRQRQLQQQQAAEQPASPAVVTFVEYARDPIQFVGAVASVVATVDEVISDRAFWLDAGRDGRVLAVVRDDVPAHEMLDINAGQRVSFEAQVLPRSEMTSLTGTLEQEAKDAIQSEPAFLAMSWADVRILSQGDQQRAQRERP